MASIFDTLTQQLGGDTLKQISGMLGTDESTTSNATGAAVSVLLGALSRNASKPDGAQALTRALAKDHDGSVLDNLGSLLGNPDAGPGAGILAHVLGGKQGRVESGLSQATGLDTGSAGKLLAMLAPVVMGALGREQRQGKLDAGAVAGMLDRENRSMAQREPSSSGILGALLDTDGDGDVDLGDMAKHGAGLLGKLFGGK